MKSLVIIAIWFALSGAIHKVHIFALNRIFFSANGFQNGCNKVTIEHRVVQLWPEIILVISNWTCAASSFNFKITRMISYQIALHSSNYHHKSTWTILIIINYTKLLVIISPWHFLWVLVQLWTPQNHFRNTHSVLPCQLGGHENVVRPCPWGAVLSLSLCA